MENVANTVEATVSEVTPATEATAPVVKTPKFLIVLDENGVELERTPLGRGRPARGSTVDADGNRVVTRDSTAVTAPKTQVMYITVDKDGKETKRENKGRGRLRTGYILHASGDFAGHYVGAPVEKPAKAPKAPKAPKAKAEDAVETPAEAPLTPEQIGESTNTKPEENCSGACPTLSL